MPEYKTVRQALSKARSNIKHFNRKFYDTYVADYNAGNYDATMHTRFYQENGGAYCEFQSIFNWMVNNI